MSGTTFVVGRCGNCGGVVSTPRLWYGVPRPPSTCESCGAVADETRGLPTIPMRGVKDERGRYVAPAQSELPIRPDGPWNSNGRQ